MTQVLTPKPGNEMAQVLTPKPGNVVAQVLTINLETTGYNVRGVTTPFTRGILLSSARTENARSNNSSPTDQLKVTMLNSSGGVTST